jgi:pimeloyl-ACP methyl ester carboxylesterase
MSTMRALSLLFSLFILANVFILPAKASIEVCNSNTCQDKPDPQVFDPIADLSGHISKFLSENIFNQDEGSTADSFPFLLVGDPFNELKKAAEDFVKFFSDFRLDSSKDESSKLDQVLGNAIVIGKSSRNKDEVWKLFVDFFSKSVEQLKDHFKNVSFDHFSPFSVLYYIEHTDEVRNPSWKRRKHRFHKQVPIDLVLELHNALYLSQLAYAGSVEMIEKGMHNFLNNTFQLIYARTEGLPGEPGHFIAIKKEAGIPKDFLQSMFKNPEKEPLEVIFVVRGTKELGDILSDTMLDAADFMNGKSHSGVSKSGEWLVAEHLEMLRSLLDASNRTKLKVTLIGHSLGAGAAAIAAMHLNEEDWVDVTSIGFGCPALLDLSQSEAVKDYVVTVITDADLVPRLSGAAMVNAFRDVTSYDWTSNALEDLELMLDWLKLPNKEGILKWADDLMNKFDRPFFGKVSSDRMEQVLYPPGTCLHVYRNGVGFAATYTACDFFDTIEFSRTMVDDHLIPSGYHKAFLELLRDHRKDFRADFPHDLMALEV